MELELGTAGGDAEVDMANCKVDGLLDVLAKAAVGEVVAVVSKRDEEVGKSGTPPDVE